MFRESLNQITLTITLSPTGPVLVKSGREAGADPTLVDMNFVRTRRPGFEKPTVFIPGSSLKGTLRSYTERVLRTVLGEGPGRCCNPFDHDRLSPACFCGKRLEKESDPERRYQESCLACRTFGNTVLGGRLSITDAYPPDGLLAQTNATEQRDGVAIDRILGSVAQGPFTLEVVTRGAFGATLTMENFELWQVGLLAVALRDLGTGLCPIGFGKTRGLGRVAVMLDQLEIAYPGRFGTESDGRHYATALYPVSAFHPEWRDSESYGLTEEMPVSLTSLSPHLSEDGTLGRVAFRLEGDQAVRGALTQLAQAWKAFALARREGGT